MKKYLTLGNILLCAAALLGLVAILLMFAPGITYTVESLNETASYSGAKITFGYTAVENVPLLGEVKAELFKFSFMNFLTYLLALVGLVFAVLAILFKCKYIAPVAAGCFLLAGIFFFCAVPFTQIGADNVIEEGYALGAGAIVSGVLSLLAAVLCALKAFVFKK